MPKILTPDIKKKIIEDWQEVLPKFTWRKAMILNRRIGPLLIHVGFSTSRGWKNDRSDRYDFGFSVHNLIRSSDFLAALLFKDFPSIPVRWHNKFYREAAERLKIQVYLPLAEDISLEHVINAYKNYVQNHNYSNQLIALIEDPDLIAAWAGEEQRAQEALEWGYKTLKAWNERTLEKGEKVSEERNADIWRAKMERLISDPEKLRQTVREEVVKHKLSKVVYEDFTDTSYREIQ